MKKICMAIIGLGVVIAFQNCSDVGPRAISSSNNATLSQPSTSLPRPSSPSIAPIPTPNLIFSPYFYSNGSSSQLITTITGASKTLLEVIPSRLSTVTWAFATGTCGSENWNGISATSFANANVASFVKAGKNYIVSTGGAGAKFLCTSNTDFIKFINTYYSANMVGVDFDIENNQTQADINSIVSVIVAAQATFPNLRYSFTLATSGGNVPQSLDNTGIMVMNAIKNIGLKNYIINLMTMDFASSGQENASLCTLNSLGLCDMGKSAIAAAENLHNYWGVPYNQIELTPMIGGNDSYDETFSIIDAASISSYVITKKLSGIHFWSLERDVDCAPVTVDNNASPDCNNYGKAGTLGFTNAFISYLGI